MKTFSKLLSEVAQPKAGDEIHFKAKHEIEKLPHSHAGDETFKGSTKKMPKRRADYEKGNDEDVYEAMDPVGKEDDDIDNDGDVDSSDKYLHARRKAISKAIKKKKNEEVEQLDELSPNTLHTYIKGAGKDLAKKSRMSGYDDKRGNYADGDKNRKKANKRLAGITSASGRLADKANMAEDAWEEIPMMSRQLQFIMYAAQEIMSYLNDCDDMCVDPEEWFQNKLAHVHGQMMTLHGYVEGDRRMSMYGEEVELDEISKKTLGSYVKKAARDMSYARGKMERNPNSKEGDKAIDTVIKRNRGITKAVNRLAKEEVELDENVLKDKNLMRKAIQKYKKDKKSGFTDSEARAASEYDHRKILMKKGLSKKNAERAAGAIARKAHQIDVLGEEVELDEISKKTLGSYVQKASRDMYDKGGRSVYHSTKANKASGPFEKETKKKHRAKAAEMERKASNRDTGIARAMSRLTKEDTELSEVTDQERLSARKIQRDAQTARHGIARKPGESMVKYLTRAKKHKEKMQKEEFELDEVTRSAIKRPVKYTDARGVTRTRMTTTRPVQHDEYGQEKIRESLQEAVKPGKLKLDDGSSITVSKKDADLINQMFNDLNKTNRKKMQDTMMSDKAGYEEIVGFAREAL